MRNEPATKKDIVEIVGQAVEELAVVVKKGFDGMETRFDKKLEALEKRMDKNMDQKITQSEERLKFHFDAAVEIIHSDLAGANKDEISLIKTKQKDHQQRIEQLEERVGIA